ncbi:MAG: GNAT family N-acetyltransferase [Anaerolineae bacterium]|nr:GNAT family N-acetyltransferase [Anaerolineae bacterium]
MIVNTQSLVRMAQQSDRHQLTNLIHFETFVHRHLDWRPPLDWLGHTPYLVAEEKGRLVAALACPPDPPGVAWIRMFASTSKCEPQQAWELLWPTIQDHFRDQADVVAAAIPMQKWFRLLLEANGFNHTHNVVMLTWDNSKEETPPAGTTASLRLMSKEDLPAVHEIDSQAFGHMWRNSLDSVEIAFQQAALATVAEVDGQICGYQISTPSPVGVHLARLAVSPDAQKQGIGYALVCHLTGQFKGAVNRRVSVNTQHNNLASLKMYQKAGFKMTGEQYPVYQFPLF